MISDRAMDRRGVVILTQHFPPEVSGNANRIWDMASNLTIRGFRVTVLAPIPSFPYGMFGRTWRLRPIGSNRLGVQLVNLWTWQPKLPEPALPSRAAYYLLFALAACTWLILRRRHYRTVISSSPPIFTGIPGLVAKRLLDKSLIYDVRDFWIQASIDLGVMPKQSVLVKTARFLEKNVIRAADVTCAVTETLASHLRREYHLASAKFEILPNGINTNFTSLPTPVRRQLVVHSGNIGYAQDLEPLLRAVPIVRERHPAARYVFAGSGDRYADLKQTARRLGVDGLVSFPGALPRQEVAAILSESMLGIALVKADLDYMVPIKVYEYMACGLPFVVTKTTETERLVRESGAGYTTDNTPNHLAHVIAALLDNPLEVAVVGERGRRFVCENNNWTTIAERLSSIIEAI